MDFWNFLLPLFNRQKQTLSGSMFWTPYEDKIICITQNNQLRPEIVRKKMLKTNIYFDSDLVWRMELMIIKG